MYYLAETDPRGAMGLGGKEELALGTINSYLAAIDYKTGKTVWRHEYPTIGGAGGNGILTTAGKLLFAGDVAGNMVAYDPANGKPLWHVYLGTQVSNAPETYMLDGHQYVLRRRGRHALRIHALLERRRRHLTRRDLGKLALAGIPSLAGISNAQPTAQANRSYINGVQFGSAAFLLPRSRHDHRESSRPRPAAGAEWHGHGGTACHLVRASLQ